MALLRKNSLPDMAFCMKMGWAKILPSKPVGKPPPNKTAQKRDKKWRPCGCGAPATQFTGNGGGRCERCAKIEAKMEMNRGDL